MYESRVTEVEGEVVKALEKVLIKAKELEANDKKYAEKIRLAAKAAGHDADTGHRDADDLLCELLESIGFSESVREFKAVDKWYS